MSIDRTFQSEMDLFLKTLDKLPESHSENRRKEEEKYKVINQLRDKVQEDSKSKKIWHGF